MMNYDDEEYDPYAGFNGGCPVHGEDYMRECTVCGAEFCTACFPNSDVCEECAEGADLDDEEGFGDGDADELKIVEELAPDDPELDKETEAALESFGDFDDEAAPTDDLFQKADTVARAAAEKAARTARKPASKPAAKPAAKKASKPKTPAKGKKAAPKAGRK